MLATITSTQHSLDLSSSNATCPSPFCVLLCSPSPFHAVLLLKEADEIIRSLPPETSSTFAKLISLISPVKA